MDSIEKAIQTVLPQLDGEKPETLVNELVTKIGVEGPDDLQYIKEDQTSAHTHSVQKDSSFVDRR